MAAAADVAVVVALAVAPADEELGSATAADMMKQISCWGVGVLGILKVRGTRQELRPTQANQDGMHKVGVGRSLIDDDGGQVWLEIDGQTISMSDEHMRFIEPIERRMCIWHELVDE